MWCFILLSSLWETETKVCWRPHGVKLLEWCLRTQPRFDLSYCLHFKLLSSGQCSDSNMLWILLWQLVFSNWYQYLEEFQRKNQISQVMISNSLTKHSQCWHHHCKLFRTPCICLFHVNFTYAISRGNLLNQISQVMGNLVLKTSAMISNSPYKILPILTPPKTSIPIPGMMVACTQEKWNMKWLAL